MLGNEETVLIEGLAKDGINLQGRAENNRVIHFPAPAHDLQKWLGSIQTVRITEVLAHTLRGEIVYAEIT